MKKKAVLLFYCILYFVSVSSAQWYDPEKVNKKAGEIYGHAYDAAVAGKYNEALQFISAALAVDPKLVDAYLTRANIYAAQKKYPASVVDFEKAMQLDSVYSNTYLLPFSISYAGAGQFQKALATVNLFLATPKLNEQSIKAGNYRKGTYEFALEQEKLHPLKDYVFAPQNMGDSINTSYLEYFPSLTIDGNKMIFNRRVDNDEDFYESNRINGTWSKAKPLQGKVNTNFNEGAQNISQDGQWLIFTGCNYPEGVGSCDLYISFKTKNGWSEAENLGLQVNTEFWESSPSLSPDKRDLYFASGRPGGFGGRDIWVVHRLGNGKWSRAENLGEAVNTKGDESCPFMHADNQTLFFNSNGHPGYGMTDLYFSKKINDSSWLEAQNLGYPINTIDDEGSLIVAADGITAYYASDKGEGKGGLDLYTFQLPPAVRPARTLWVKGQVFDKRTMQGLPSSVELTDINTRNMISKLQTDEDGNYLVTLPEGKDYAFNVNRKGYLFFSENFSLAGNTADSVFTKNIPLQPLEKGAAVVLKNIFFESKKYELQPGSIVELNKVVALLNDNPSLKIGIEGYTDNVGKPADNLVLSNERAKAVVAYLTGKGIAAGRLSYKGFGETNPVADNSTDAGKALNRRTELRVTGN